MRKPIAERKRWIIEHYDEIFGTGKHHIVNTFSDVREPDDIAKLVDSIIARTSELELPEVSHFEETERCLLTAACHYVWAHLEPDAQTMTAAEKLLQRITSNSDKPGKKTKNVFRVLPNGDYGKQMYVIAMHASSETFCAAAFTAFYRMLLLTKKERREKLIA